PADRPPEERPQGAGDHRHELLKGQPELRTGLSPPARLGATRFAAAYYSSCRSRTRFVYSNWCCRWASAHVRGNCLRLRTTSSMAARTCRAHVLGSTCPTP